MSYIGKTPTSVPLTSSDITDGIITTTKIADANVTNPKLTSGSQQNFRNIIINGDMSIAQRGTSTSGITGSGVFVVDRWKMDEVADSTLTMSQETLTSGDAYNNGFKKSLKVLVTTADTSIGTTQSVQLTQPVEAQNLQYLNFGTANAKDLTLSFWYKSNVTGVHTVCIDKMDSTRAACPLEFTVSSADTWTKYTLNANANSVVQGSTAAIANDNGTGFRVMWGLAYGSAYQSGTNGTWVQNGTGSFTTSNQQNILASASNYIELTGVQLEAGTTASDFEFLPVDINEQRCFRYFYMVGDEDEQGMGTAFYRSNNSVRFMIEPPFRMRTTPSLDQSTATNSFRVLTSGGGDDLLDDWTIMSSSTDRFIIVVNTADASGTGGQAGYAIINLADTHFALTAEL